MAAVYAVLGKFSYITFRYSGRHSSQQKPAEPLRGDASEATNWKIVSCELRSVHLVLAIRDHPTYVSKPSQQPD